MCRFSSQFKNTQAIKYLQNGAQVRMSLWGALKTKKVLYEFSIFNDCTRRWISLSRQDRWQRRWRLARLVRWSSATPSKAQSNWMTATEIRSWWRALCDFGWWLDAGCVLLWPAGDIRLAYPSMRSYIPLVSVHVMTALPTSTTRAHMHYHARPPSLYLWVFLLPSIRLVRSTSYGVYIRGRVFPSSPLSSLHYCQMRIESSRNNVVAPRLYGPNCWPSFSPLVSFSLMAPHHRIAYIIYIYLGIYSPRRADRGSPSQQWQYSRRAPISLSSRREGARHMDGRESRKKVRTRLEHFTVFVPAKTSERDGASRRQLPAPHMVVS